MDAKLYAILKKVYIDGYKKGFCAYGENGVRLFSAEHLKDAEKAYLAQSAYELNRVVEFHHDDVISRLKTIVAHNNLSLQRVLDGFIGGVSGSYPRGLQSVISYVYAQHLPQHSLDSDGNACMTCGLHRSASINAGEVVFRFYHGYAWNEMPWHYVLDLEELATQPAFIPNADDKDIFSNLLKLIHDADEKESVGKLEKRIKAAKIIPYSDVYKIRGILIALAELGIMPSALIDPSIDRFITLKEKLAADSSFSRSDVVVPLKGWNGSLKIDKERVNRLFGFDL